MSLKLAKLQKMCYSKHKTLQKMCKNIIKKCKKCAHFYNLYDIMAIVGGNNGKICI